jgi:hypothetical protein
MAVKIEMAKMDDYWGTIELLDDGTFRFEGPQAWAMQEFMEEVQKLRNVKGAAALDAFVKAFSHGSYWFNEIDG